MRLFFSILLILLGVGAVYWFNSGQQMSLGELRSLGEVATTSEPAEYEIEEVVSGLEVPWSIIFTSEDRFLVSERPGRIRIVEDDELQRTPLHTFLDVASRSESGLMSLALHPQYASNKLVYAVYTYDAGGSMRARVVRFRDDGTSISGLTTVIDNIPAAQNHAGSRLRFGPDGKLYVTTGDATDRPLAQDLDSLAGKILRMNDDGTIPADNPFTDSPIWSYGHRNPQGISFRNGNLYETEHGPSGFDGPGGGDEVNLIQKGENYGWPLVSHEKAQAGLASPLLIFTPAEAPAAVLAYSGKLFPQFANTLFIGALRGEGLIRVAINQNNPSDVLNYEKLGDVDFGRIREVTESPDGAIYFSTSNRDGRGSPATADDRIFRIVPVR